MISSPSRILRFEGVFEGVLRALSLPLLDLILWKSKQLDMASSSRRSTRAATAADAAIATVAVDRVGGVAIGLRRSRPVAGAIAPASARLGACCFFFTCLSCMHVPVWVRGICLGTVETIPIVGLQFSRAPLLKLVETIPLRWVSVLQALDIIACRDDPHR